jgi:ornithine cyclodeaminase
MKAAILDADQVRSGTRWRLLIDAIGAIVASDRTTSPERHVHEMDLPDGSTGSLLIMPSWIAGDVVGVKAVTYVPSNAGPSTPTINAAYLLFDGRDGHLLAVLDGDELTARRTAAVSALAADHLSRNDSKRLLVVGTGQLARTIPQAYSEIRQLEVIEIWGRSKAAAAAVVEELVGIGLPARRSSDLAGSIRSADIVSCVTGSPDPLVHGADLRPGVHLDLVGSFRADMRESDDDAVTMASLFVDTVAGAVKSGDLAQPLADGVITAASIRGDLRALIAGEHAGRTSGDEITVFKSAGFALADLAAARLAFDHHVELRR